MLHQSNFRGDVEALRGIAVILVVLFHLKINAVASGFIGVDIFFVISGYLMAVAFNNPGLSILEFYERRARRVLPAALIIMLLFFLFSPLFFLPFEAQKIAEPFWGLLAFAPNLIFWKIDDYFSALNFTPTLHYWSLGVELQYYIVFPILVYFFRKNIIWFAVLGTLSLLLCIYVTPLMSKTAFFMLPTRLWEFLLGFAAYQLNMHLISKQLFKPRFNTVTVSIATTLLLLYALYPIPQNQFPGFYAIPAALLSFLIISIGVPDDILKTLPGMNALRWIGKLSYSIYLVHYLVIFVFLYGPFSEWRELDLKDSVLILIITLALSVLSHRYIEVPFRNRKSLSLKWFLASIFGLYAVSIGAIITYQNLNYFTNLYPKHEQHIFNAMHDVGNSRCSKIQKLLEFRESSCYLYEAKAPSKVVYLVGDSQMDALKEAFVASAKQHNVTVRLNRNRCFLGEGQCSTSEIVNQIQKYKITDVALHGWAYDKFNYENLELLVEQVKTVGVRIHFIGPVPTFDKSIPLALYKETLSNTQLVSRKSKEEHQQGIAEKYVKFVAKNKEEEGVFFYWPDDYFCTPECQLGGDSGVYYYDDHHPTMTGAMLIKPIFDSINLR
jgi:peptidoglycan/LPS O-acetylase OafA/YrhL